MLVNNVGTVHARDSFLTVTDHQWLEMFELNFFSAVRAARAALPAMVSAGGGAVINISSVGARVADPIHIDYCASKAAMTSFTKALSEEFATQGVRINTISPGPVLTTLWSGPNDGDDESFAVRFADKIGVTSEEFLGDAGATLIGTSAGRWGTASEIADLVAFLVSDRAAFITGSDYVIDGGFMKTV